MPKFNDYPSASDVDGTELILVRKWNPTRNSTGAYDTFKLFLSSIIQNAVSSALSQVEVMANQMKNYITSNDQKLSQVTSDLASSTTAMSTVQTKMTAMQTSIDRLILDDEQDASQPKVFKYTGNVTLPNLTVGRTTVTASVAGVKVGDALSISLGAALPNGLSIAYWRVTTNDQIAIDISAALIAAATSTPIPLNVIVVR